MKPIKFAECTGALQPPTDMGESILPLPYQQKFVNLGDPFFPDNEAPYIITKWELTPEELQHINEQGALYLSFLGTTIPPILPSVAHPFPEVTGE